MHSTRHLAALTKCMLSETKSKGTLGTRGVALAHKKGQVWELRGVPGTLRLPVLARQQPGLLETLQSFEFGLQQKRPALFWL